jgi:predicted nucleic-acid-binding protein
MSEHDTDITLLDVDEAWAAEWAAAGIAACERYLAKHAAFSDYLHARADLDCDDGDRRPDA